MAFWRTTGFFLQGQMHAFMTTVVPEGKERRRATFVDVPPESYICRSLICVAMYHLFPKLSFTPALRSPFG